MITLLAPYSERKPIKFNRDFEERKLWFIALVSNRPFPSSLVPLFQNESKSETFHMKMSSACSFIFMPISHFHKNGFALRLALKQRHKGTRKWPIVCIVHARTYPRKSSRLRPLRHRRFYNNYGLWCNRLQGVNKSYVVAVSCCARD